MFSFLLMMASFLALGSILQEKSLSPTEACKIIPGRPHRNTVQRWMTKGYDGVVLRSFRVAGKRFTTQEAVEEFVSALSAKDTLGVKPVSSAHSEAESQLDELGV